MTRRILLLTACSLVALQAQPEPAKASVAPTLVHYTETHRKTIVAADRTLTLIRVRPPALPKTPSPLPPAMTPSDAEQSRLWAEKDHATLSLSATVYLGRKKPLTELRWRDETGRHEYRAWSNVDFRHLTSLSTLDTATTVYSWFPFVDVWDLADLPRDQKSPVPANLALSENLADYRLAENVSDISTQETTLAGLDYLHAYYQLHAARLKAEFEKREADNAAREKQLRQNPPKPAPVTLRWWPLAP